MSTSSHTEHDRYGRTLGVVYVDGMNVNLEMVKAGLAEVYRGKPASGFDNGPYQDAEDAARRAGMGMWSLGDKYVSPKGMAENTLKLNINRRLIYAAKA